MCKSSHMDSFAACREYVIPLKNRVKRLKKSEVIESILKNGRYCDIIENDILCRGEDHESKLQKALETARR